MPSAGQQPFVDIQAKIVCSISYHPGWIFSFAFDANFHCSRFIHAARLRISHHLWLEMCTRKPVHPFHPSLDTAPPSGCTLSGLKIHASKFSISAGGGVDVACAFYFYVAFRLRAMTSSDGSGKKCHIHKEGFHQGIRFLHAIEIEFVVRLFAVRCIFDCLWCY